jgi:membrane protease YdiL (CAAX protease family)
MKINGRPSSAWQRRIAALLEIIGVFIGGTLLARLISSGLNLGPGNIRSLEPGEVPDFAALSLSTGANLLIRYGAVLGLAFAVGWWHRRRPLAAYGVTTGGLSIRDHVGIAMLLFASVGFMSKSLLYLKDIVPLGRGPQHWTLLESPDYSAWFWLYMAVSSFALVPVLEELLARGYWQSRLTEDFGPASAILMTALSFALAHTQYFIASPLGVSMLASLLVGGIVGGYVRYRTGSLLSVMIAHALGNVPLRGWIEAVVLVLMALVIGLWWRTIYGYAKKVWHDVMIRAVVAPIFALLVVAAITLALIMLTPTLLPLWAALTLGAALFLESQEKRSVSQPR